MNERGGFLAVVGITFLVIILLVVGAGVYFYNFYVFKTLRVCVSEEFTDLLTPCESVDICVVMVKNGYGELGSAIKGAPNVFTPLVEEVVSEAVYCENTCKAKRVSGIGGVMELESCGGGEKEIIYEIRGGEGLKLLEFLKSNGESMS